MLHKNWTIYIGTIITTTTFIAIFVLGPYEISYFFIKEYDGTFNIDSTHTTLFSAATATNDLNIWKRVYISVNSTILHTIIPWLVIYDFSKTYYANKKQSNLGINVFAITYFILYIAFVNIYGSLTDIYPYTPLDPNAFDNDVISLIHQIISPIIGFMIYLIFLRLWNKKTTENNIYQT